MNPIQMIVQMFGNNNISNPFSIMQSMQRSGKNPVNLMQNMMGNNPQFQRVMQMVNGKSPEEVQQIAKNLCAQRGINFDEAVEQMKKMGINMPDYSNTPKNAK